MKCPWARCGAVFTFALPPGDKRTITTVACPACCSIEPLQRYQPAITDAGFVEVLGYLKRGLDKQIAAATAAASSPAPEVAPGIPWSVPAGSDPWRTAWIRIDAGSLNDLDVFLANTALRALETFMLAEELVMTLFRYDGLGDPRTSGAWSGWRTARKYNAAPDSGIIGAEHYTAHEGEVPSPALVEAKDSDRSPWTHAICPTCWAIQKPDTPLPLGFEARGEVEPCCYCGAIQNAGIYVRGDPAFTQCRGKHTSSKGGLS